MICENYATTSTRSFAAGWPSTRRQALRRDDFPSVEDLTAAIGRVCQSWTSTCQPFSWTEPADQILTKLNRQTDSATQH
jgi:hypothetical protein